MIIKWSSTFSISQGFITLKNASYYPVTKHEVPSPTIYLLDADMDVLLKTEPSGDESSRIEGQETHRLRGYGTTFLWRLFNKNTFVANDDPIFAETANFAVSFAILLSKALRRRPLGVSFSDRGDVEDKTVPSQCYLSTERWQLSDSSHLLFQGIKIDKKTVNDHLDRLSGKHIDDMVLPTGVRNHLEHFSGHIREQFLEDRQTFFDNINQLASWILAFANVVNINSCADLPLHFLPVKMVCVDLLGWNGLDLKDIQHDIFFELIRKMMMKERMDGPITFLDLRFFLTSHQGWSLFYSSVGDHDPEDINCELLYIKRGVPTNTRTGERKYRITDAPSIRNDSKSLPRLIDTIGNSYLPRCVAKIYKRAEHYTSRSDEFWLSIRFDVKESEYSRPVKTVDRSSEVPVLETVGSKEGKDTRYSLFASYEEFNSALWGVVKTTPCHHRNPSCEPLPLDLDACTVGGLIWAKGDGEARGNRICICLIKGDARARWLAVYGIIANSGGGILTRQVLLRLL